MIIVYNFADTRHGQNCNSLNCDLSSTDCVILPASGPTCLCKPGFKPDPMSILHCTDINECETGICQHQCENVLGSYTCGCRDGFTLSASSCHHCSAISVDAETMLLFSTPKMVYRMDKGTSYGRKVLLESDSTETKGDWHSSIPFDYGRTDDLLIYYNFGKIVAQRTNVADKSWMLLNVSHDVTWLTYDEINNNVYFNSESGNFHWQVFYIGIMRITPAGLDIEVASVSRSSEVKTVVPSSPQTSVASQLVVFPEVGYMFYKVAEKEKEKLVYCYLNGEKVQTYNGNFMKITSISLDRSSFYVYIYDSLRPGIAQILVNNDESPAKIEPNYKWIEERKSFFGPKSHIIQFASGDFDSAVYFLKGEITKVC